MQDHPDDNPIDYAAAATLTEALKNANPTQCLYCGDPTDALVCDHCDAKAEAHNAAIREKERQSQIAARLSWFRSKIPENYLDPDDLLTPRWAGEMAQLWNPRDRYGVTLTGPSRTWKTRAGIKILERGYLAGTHIEFRQAGEIRREVNRLARDGKDSDYLKEMIAIPLLLIDDLGNQAFTETSEEFFLALLEGRVGKRNPTIITTQFPSEEFIAKTTNRRIGMAIAQRIGPEYQWVVNTITNPATITPPAPPKQR